MTGNIKLIKSGLLQPFLFMYEQLQKTFFILLREFFSPFILTSSGIILIEKEKRKLNSEINILIHP
jgi:hypothetical protein